MRIELTMGLNPHHLEQVVEIEVRIQLALLIVSQRTLATEVNQFVQSLGNVRGRLKGDDGFRGRSTRQELYNLALSLSFRHRSHTLTSYLD
jgi:hypothetical protein